MLNYKKTNMDKSLFSRVFSLEDFGVFLKIINNKRKKIQMVSTLPIDNFDHNIVNLIDKDVLVYLYQHIKFYLEQKDEYPSKMQEGLALCASKAIMIETFYPNLIDCYISVGDKAGSGSRTNPFEEIFRMLLVTTKNEKYSNNFGNIPSEPRNKGELGYESNLFLDVVKNALNKRKFAKMISKYSEESDILDIIGNEVEKSSIESSKPLSATLKENRDYLVVAFDRIYGLYQDKILCRQLIGDISNNNTANTLLTRLSNKIIYAKKNIGIYQKTKVLSKENKNN